MLRLKAATAALLTLSLAPFAFKMILSPLLAPKESVLRVSYPFFQSVRTIDTSNISTVFQYNLANNLYSRLVEYNSDNQLVAGACSSFTANGGKVTFSFGRKTSTVDGHTIRAIDAAISLKRLVLLGRSGHGDIRKLLCPNQSLKSVHDECPGIRVEGGNLILTPIRPHFVPFLISALESADYGIIPKGSLSPDGLTIVDYRNTSGPYYVEADAENGALTLKANPNHYHYHKLMPQTVKLVPTQLRDGAGLLEAGEVDLVTTSEYYSGPAANRILGQDSKFTVFASQPFRVDLVAFSANALKKLSVNERIRAAQVYADAKTRLFPPLGAQPTFQFFQSLSDGTLSKEQSAEIQALRNSGTSPKEPVGLGVHKSYVEAYAKELGSSPEIKIVGLDKYAFEYPMNLRADMYFIATDSAWTENLSLLGHNFEMGIFHLVNLDANQWLADYLETPAKEDRIRRLNKLHFDLLKAAAIFPFAAYPYYAVTTKNWILNFSTLSSTTDLWRMRSL